MDDGLFLSSCLEASRAVYRSVTGRLEGDLCFTTALCADCSEVFLGCLTGILSCIAASLAALRLILEALLLVESLFTGSEGKFVATLFADKCFVFEYFAVHRFVLVHWMLPRFVKMVKIFFARSRSFTDIFEIVASTL
jgi:hypothetical protein